MLLALIIGAATVVAFICSFAMFLQYMREDADDDDNSKRPAGVNRVRPVAEGQALGTTEVGAGSMIEVLRRNSVMASIALMRSCTVGWRFFFSSQRRPIANCLKSFLS